MSEKLQPLALDAYETIAEAYGNRVETKPHNAYLERPATLSLLPPVKDRNVVDAGCGPGIYTQWLVEQGASVVGVDVSSRMVEQARRRVDGRAKIEQADLAAGLDFLPDNAFDLVLSSLTLHYLYDITAVFREFHRLLKPGGHLVFSIHHPLDEQHLHEPEDYFETKRVEYEWTGFGKPVVMPSYRRPLSRWTESLAAEHFLIERIVEPEPTEDFRKAAPRQYAQVRKRPPFLCFRARRTS